MDRVVIRPDPTPDPALDAPPADTPPSRPSWLPEKFENPEALAKAYGELEKRMSTPSPKPEIPPVEGQFSMDAAVQEFLQNGALSEATTKLLPVGVTPDVISTYVTGQQARAEQFKREVSQVVGGVEQMETIFSWAKTALSPEEVAAYNTAASAGDSKAAALALRGIAALHREATGNEPQLQSGPGTPSSAGTKPFGSWAQVTSAMNDPRYAADPAFRTEVQQRIAVSRL